MFNFLQRNGISIAAITDCIILGFYIYFLARNPKFSWNDSELISTAIQLCIAGFSAASGLVLFLTLFVIPNKDWGNFSEQKTNLFIGCFVSMITSGYLVLKILAQVAEK